VYCGDKLDEELKNDGVEMFRPTGRMKLNARPKMAVGCATISATG
jgi:hypothetical protein